MKIAFALSATMIGFFGIASSHAEAFANGPVPFKCGIDYITDQTDPEGSRIKNPALDNILISFPEAGSAKVEVSVLTEHTRILLYFEKLKPVGVSPEDYVFSFTASAMDTNSVVGNGSAIVEKMPLKSVGFSGAIYNGGKLGAVTLTCERVKGV